MRRVIAALVVVGLAIAVVVLWPRSDDVNTAGEVTTTTSTSTTAPDSTTTTSTTVATTSTTSVLDDHVVETVEEAEAILRELWFGWFEGIYNEDEERIREVVVLEETVETAKESFGVAFERAPEPEDITFEDTQLLRSDEECLAVHTTLVLTGFREGVSEGVEILRWTHNGWKSLSTWGNPNDLWEADCDSSLP
jgi:hypothetical protein